MHQGDIGLVAIEGRIGAGIRVGQWLVGDGYAHYEHAFVRISETEVVEAEPGGARLGWLSKYTPSEVVWLRCPEQFRLKVVTTAINMIGVPYSFLDYLAIALHRVRIPAPHLRQSIEDSGHMICSQLCDRAAELGGWHLFDDGRWHGYVTPGDLYQLSIR